LRVSGGRARGRRLKAPKNIRPTQGVVKQAIFNMLGSRIEGAHVLDLFAGSGALGIEALSRGAASVTFVDRHERGLAILRQNLDALGFKERSRVVRGDVVRWLEASPDAIKSAGFVFLDPPYGDDALDLALKVLEREVT
jgi:16S rRNA (guanine(966)-N(2))-methyltransferase RsmD